MQRRSNVATGIIFILVMVLHALTVSTARGQTIIPIAQARKLQPDPATPVSVQGWVTVPNVIEPPPPPPYTCIFESFSFDCGFAIQDNNAGIYVRVPVPPSPPPQVVAVPNQKFQVTGCLVDSFGLLILSTDPADCTIEVNLTPLSSFKPIAPQQVATGFVNEDTEGSLVHVVGTVTQSIKKDLPYGYRVFIDDGSGEIEVFIAASTNIDPYQIPFIKKDQPIQVTGFSGEFTPPGTPPHFEINPRFMTDINPAP